jgi:hypothetical protein
MDRTLLQHLRAGDTLKRTFDHGGHQIWTITDVVEANGIRHVRLQLSSDPTVVKTLSADSLLNFTGTIQRHHSANGALLHTNAMR